jgi:hypothetical protein
MLLVTIPVWALLLVGAYWNAHLFFDVQISDAAVRREYLHSTEITAAYIAKQTDKPYVHLIGNSAFYKYGMDFAWLAGFPRGDRDLSLSSALPHRFDDEAALYVFMPPYSDGEPAKVVSAFYPNATCENELAPWGDQFYIACRVSAQDVQGMRGLTARYRSGAQDAVRKDAALNLAWGAGAAPLSGVFSAEWEGAIYIPAYGPMTLGVESTAPFSVTIDGVTLSTLSAAERNLTLYQGWHAIRASMSGATGDGVTRLYRVVDGKRQPFGPESFAAFSPANGLYGRIYAGAAWQGAVMAERFDPFMDMFANPETAETRPGPTLGEGPFSAEWAATLLIERDGLYRFRAGAISGMSELTINGKKVAATAVADYNQSISGDGEITLAPGQHTLRFRYSYNRGQMARCWLYWSPPGEAMGQIPYQVLTPIRP